MLSLALYQPARASCRIWKVRLARLACRSESLPQMGRGFQCPLCRRTYQMATYLNVYDYLQDWQQSYLHNKLNCGRQYMLVPGLCTKVRYVVESAHFVLWLAY